jgi:hypothetical protein
MPQRYTQREQLELFVGRVQELVDRRLYKSGGLKHVEFNWEYENRSGEDIITHNITEIDEEDFRSFLTSFRLFVLKSEATYLATILALAENTLTVDARNESFAKAKADWEGIYDGSSEVSLYEGDKKLRPLEVLSLWLDGKYFHSDSDKSQQMENWGDFKPLLRAEFVFLIQKLTNIIVWLGDYVGYGLKNEWFKFKSED